MYPIMTVNEIEITHKVCPATGKMPRSTATRFAQKQEIQAINS